MVQLQFYKIMNNEKKINEAIEDWINNLKNKRGFYEGKAISLWGQIVGEQIKEETETIYIKDRIMFVKLKSDSLKYELEFAKKKLVKNINNLADFNVIDEIFFL